MPTFESVPLLDVQAQNLPLMPQFREAFERVARHGNFILGAEVSEFESNVASYLGVKHAIGVSSGTDALLVALMALGIGSGDEVITTPFSFFATAGCIARVGATPVFVDIDPVTFNIDVTRIEDAITPRTKAIMPVHLFGQPSEMRAVREVAHRRGLRVIEDAAQAIGARTDQGPVGALGDVACFSFFPSKNLGAFGDAGLVTVADDALAERIRLLRTHGAKPKYFHAEIGGNFRLDALQAALLAVKLPCLDGWAEGRSRNAAQYTALLSDIGLPAESLTLPVSVAPGHVWNQYTLRTNRRDELQQHLVRNKIGCEVYYPLPLHLQKCFAHLGYAEGSMPEAECAAKQVLSLPIFPELGAERLRYVADQVRHALQLAADRAPA
jgi:dTDP-4-amino-4,6-dideoxygalactose transaminase